VVTRAMKFVTDPAVVARVRQLILHEPDLNVLRPTPEGEYAALVQRIEADLKRRNAEGKLLLPDLSALSNRSVGIFSDYGGESGSGYRTYSFLICAYNVASGPFFTHMKKIRAEYKLGDKEIAFKDFGMGQMRAALPAYLDALHGYVPGFLLTLVVDKRLKSVFGPADKESRQQRMRALQEFGYKSAKYDTIEKALRVTHTAAYLTALLAHQGQKLLWMSDHDAICANQEIHESLLRLFQNALGLYTLKTFPLLGGVRPFAERDTNHLDLLSAADVTAGALAQYFTDRDAVGEEQARIKEGAEQVLLWLCHDGLGLKKLCLLMRLGDDGTLVSGPIEFTPKVIRDGAKFLPIELCR
jgi:hypothetical protein